MDVRDMVQIVADVASARYIAYLTTDDIDVIAEALRRNGVQQICICNGGDE